MCKNFDLSFDQFMMAFVNEKRNFCFKLMGLKIKFKHKNNKPVLLLDDSCHTKEYEFESAFDICRLSFNGILFSVLFNKLELVV